MTELPTKAEYDTASPFLQGFMAYTFSAWPNSEIPNERFCPHRSGTTEYADFQRGVHAAVLSAQDSEE